VFCACLAFLNFLIERQSFLGLSEIGYQSFLGLSEIGYQSFLGYHKLPMFLKGYH
jgi:hypothetical protein